ncbi:unnamed protein product [Sphagnum balticum]
MARRTHDDTGCKPDQLRQVEQESHVSASASKEADHGLGQTKLGRSKTGALEIDGFSIEKVSVGGQETCVMIPATKVAFDIGRCPEQAVSQDFLFITHAHMDHIIGEELNIGRNLVVKPFQTYHVIPSQGYIVYWVKNKLKKEYLGLPLEKIKALKLSGVQITDTIRVPEVAFTGDTTPYFILDKANKAVLESKLLIMEVSSPIPHAAVVIET